MSGEIPSLVDLQNTKVRIDHFAELIDGTPSGTSTNPITGVTHPTYEKAIKDLGFKPGSGSFTTGFTINPGEYDVAWYDPVSSNWYSWDGVIPTGGLVVAPGTNPAASGSGYTPRTDIVLRPVVLEALRRSYADAGYTLVSGSFEEGGTLTSASDVLLHNVSAKAYGWTGAFPKVVAPGTNPAAVAGFVTLSGVLLRGELASANGAYAIGTLSGANLQDVINNLAGRADLDDAEFAELYGPNGSLKIGHEQGVGGSTRTVRAVLRDRFNIQDFKVNTDSDWTNAFQRAASSGESVSLYIKDLIPGLYAPIIIDSPVTFHCEGGFRQQIAKAHGGSMFDIRSSGVNISDMLVYNDEALGAGGRVILLDTAASALENIRLKNIHQSGGSQSFLTDSGSGSAGLIVDLLLEDIKLNGLSANAIALTKAFAYLDMKKVTVNYVPSASKAFIGISITGNEGCNLEWCHVNHGITAATPYSYGFVFSNSKAIWMDRCQADTCGVDGFRFENCQYVYGNQLSASLCGGDGITMSGSDITIGNSYFGGRRGLTYQGATGSALVRSTASRAFLNGCNLSNGGFNGFVTSASTVLSGGGIFNTVTPYSISGAAKLRQVMNDAGALIDAG